MSEAAAAAEAQRRPGMPFCLWSVRVGEVRRLAAPGDDGNGSRRTACRSFRVVDGLNHINGLDKPRGTGNRDLVALTNDVVSG